VLGIKTSYSALFRNWSASKAKIMPRFALFDSVNLGEGWAKCLSAFYEFNLGSTGASRPSGELVSGCQKRTEAKQNGLADKRDVSFSQAVYRTYSFN